MKKIKKIIAVILLLALSVCIINSQTDLFLNFASYAPSIAEKYPAAAQFVTDASERISLVTDNIPSPSEIIAMIKHEEPPVDPSDAAANAYIENSPMLTFYPKENIGIVVDYNTVDIFGVVDSRAKSHLIAEITDENGETLDQVSLSANSSGEFNKKTDIPETESLSMDLSIYTGSKAYGQFESWVYNYITLQKTADGGWEIAPSPVFENNKLMYERDKSISDALRRTASIQSDSTGIASIAAQLTEGLTEDYDKVLALHDWICSYMYYDIDSLSAEDTPPYYATEIVKSRRAVCLGFATLMAALCRSIDIPCNVVSGYALGVSDGANEWNESTAASQEQNHAWNEVYMDGRWVIIDTTWDCANKIENGEMIKGNGVSHLYFDANLQFFSNNHKIIEYSKRR